MNAITSWWIKEQWLRMRWLIKWLQTQDCKLLSSHLQSRKLSGETPLKEIRHQPPVQYQRNRLALFRLHKESVDQMVSHNGKDHSEDLMGAHQQHQPSQRLFMARVSESSVTDGRLI